MHIILMGPPGCGKGTQAERIEKHYHLTHLSTGALFREHIAKKTKLGRLAQKYMDAGKYVPDRVTIGMVKEFMQKHPAILFDGFPRTRVQAVALDKMCKQLKQQLIACVFLDVPDQESVKRIILRGKKGSGRSDDNEATAKLRLKEYYQKTHELCDYYHKHHMLLHVNGFQKIPAVTTAVCNKLDRLIIKKRKNN